MPASLPNLELLPQIEPAPLRPSTANPAIRNPQSERASPLDSPRSEHPAPRSLSFRVWYAVCYTLEWLFGLASLIGCLAVLAAIPLLNFLSLGYLLEASGRVASSGRLRDGFIDIDKFARIGSLVAG